MFYNLFKPPEGGTTNMKLCVLYHDATNRNRGLKTEPRGQLEGSRATSAEDRADPSARLPEGEVRVTAGCRGSGPNVGVQCAAIIGQVRNVEDVEAISDQI